MPRAWPTERDDRILAWYRAFMRDNDYSPSFRQIAEEFGVGVHTVHKTLHRLVESGRLKGFRKG